MTLRLTRPLAVVSLLLSCASCVASSAGSGMGGEGGAAGAGGAGGATSAPTAGLWVGQSNGLDVCFFINTDGSILTRSAECDIDGASSSGNSYELDIEAVGRDENDEPCSFTLSYQPDVAIDRVTGAFGAAFTEAGTGADLSFSGELIGLEASGIATRSDGSSQCTVGWAASRAAPCDDAAINACLDLLDCCRAILVNPVFFQSCDQVVLECNEVRCREVLAGYPQCAQLEL